MGFVILSQLECFESIYQHFDAILSCSRFVGPSIHISRDSYRHYPEIIPSDRGENEEKMKQKEVKKEEEENEKEKEEEEGANVSLFLF